MDELLSWNLHLVNRLVGPATGVLGSDLVYLEPPLVLYPSGGRATFALAAEPAMAIVDAAGISNVGDLVGLPWHVLAGGRDGISKLIRGN